MRRTLWSLVAAVLPTVAQAQDFHSRAGEPYPYGEHDAYTEPGAYADSDSCCSSSRWKSFGSKCKGCTMCWKAWWYGHDYDACGCYWPGEYKWPVPPYYTYHWPGQYASPVVAEYTPLRFEPLMLPPQPEDVVSVKYQVRETFRKSIERLRNPNGDGPVAPSKPAPTAAPVPRPAPQRGDEQSRLVPDPRFEDPRQPAPTPMYQALPRQTGVQQSFGVANGWPAPLPGAWAPFKRRPANP